MLIHTLCGLGWLLLLAAVAWALGWLTWGRRRPALLLHPFPVALGFALLGQLALLLAAAGALQPLPVALLAATLLLAATPGLAAVAGLAAGRSGRPLARTLLLGGAALAPSLLIALYPPHAFDEITYHLAFTRALAGTGNLPFLPELRVPVFPLLAEALQAPMLMAAGEVGPHLVGVLASALSAALVAVAGRELLAPAAGWIAAGLLAGSPLIVYVAGTGLVEAPLMLLASASLYAAASWRRTREPAWAAVAGALAGSAAAVKYLGLFFVGALLVGLLLDRAGWRRALPRFLLAATLAAAPTYGFLLATTGSPLVPFFPDLVGHTPWDPSAGPGPPLVERAGDWATLTWDAVANREKVGRQPPLSPAYLLGIPLLIVAAVARRALLPALALLLGYLAIFLVVPPDARYLLPVLPLWSLLVAGGAIAGWRRARGRPPSDRAAALLACGLALPGLLYAPFFVARRGPIPTTREESAQHLAEQVSGYRALDWLEARQGMDYVLYAYGHEYLHGLARGRLLGELDGPYRFQALGRLSDPGLAGRLRGMGATHLLLPRGRLGEPSPAGLQRLYVDAEVELYRVW